MYKKRGLALILAILMVVTMLPSAAFAFEFDGGGGDLSTNYNYVEIKAGASKSFGAEYTHWEREGEQGENESEYTDPDEFIDLDAYRTLTAGATAGYFSTLNMGNSAIAATAEKIFDFANRPFPAVETLPDEIDIDADEDVYVGFTMRAKNPNVSGGQSISELITFAGNINYDSAYFSAHSVVANYIINNQKLGTGQRTRITANNLWGQTSDYTLGAAATSVTLVDQSLGSTMVSVPIVFDPTTLSLHYATDQDWDVVIRLTPTGKSGPTEVFMGSSVAVPDQGSFVPMSALVTFEDIKDKDTATLANDANAALNLTTGASYNSVANADKFVSNSVTVNVIGPELTAVTGAVAKAADQTVEVSLSNDTFTSAAIDGATASPSTYFSATNGATISAVKNITATTATLTVNASGAGGDFKIQAEAVGLKTSNDPLLTGDIALLVPPQGISFTQNANGLTEWALSGATPSTHSYRVATASGWSNWTVVPADSKFTTTDMNNIKAAVTTTTPTDAIQIKLTADTGSIAVSTLQLKRAADPATLSINYTTEKTIETVAATVGYKMGAAPEAAGSGSALDLTPGTNVTYWNITQSTGDTINSMPVTLIVKPRRAYAPAEASTTRTVKEAGKTTVSGIAAGDLYLTQGSGLPDPATIAELITGQVASDFNIAATKDEKIYFAKPPTVDEFATAIVPVTGVGFTWATVTDDNPQFEDQSITLTIKNDIFTSSTYGDYVVTMEPLGGGASTPVTLTGAATASAGAEVTLTFDDPLAEGNYTIDLSSSGISKNVAKTGADTDSGAKTYTFRVQNAGYKPVVSFVGEATLATQHSNDVTVAPAGNPLVITYADLEDWHKITAANITGSGLGSVSVTGDNEITYTPAATDPGQVVEVPITVTIGINKKEIAVVSATVSDESKPYDGTASADNVTIEDVVFDGEYVTLEPVGIVSNKLYNSKNVGSGKSIKANVTLDTSTAKYYTLTNGTAFEFSNSGEITAIDIVTATPTAGATGGGPVKLDLPITNAELLAIVKNMTITLASGSVSDNVKVSALYDDATLQAIIDAALAKAGKTIDTLGDKDALEFEFSTDDIDDVLAAALNFTKPSTAVTFSVFTSYSAGFKITYDLNKNGTLKSGSLEETVPTDAPKPKNVPTVDANTFYTFLGWSKSAGSKSLVDPTTVTVTKDTTFYAQYDFGYIKGSSPDTISPSANITRQEFITMLVRASSDFDGTKADYYRALAVKTFGDISKTGYAAPYIGYALENKITAGITATEFAPTATITREQAATFVSRALKLTLGSGTGSKPTDLADASNFAKKHIEALFVVGFIGGYEDGSFKPANLITRAETATMINPFFGRKLTAAEVRTLRDSSKTKINNPFKDLPQNSWMFPQMMLAAGLLPESFYVVK